jgi:heat shock protein HslJ
MKLCTSFRRVAVLLALVATTAPVAAQETPLVCFGTEPFWRLGLVEPGEARFSTVDSSEVTFRGAAQALAHRGETVWRGAGADGGELVAFLREEACSDQMSDAVHPFTINVSLPDGRHLAGCCRRQGEQAGLEGAEWRLTELAGEALPAGRQQAVSVRFTEGRVQGFTGCNQFNGPYTLEGERFTLGNLGVTQMACPEPAMSLERGFLDAFSGAFNLAVVGDTLTLDPPEGGAPLVFARQAAPALAGVEWEVTGFNNGRQAVVGLLPDTRITLQFDDGLVSGSSGCNRFSGSFSSGEGTLTIGMLRLTRMACESEVMEQEQQFLAALQSATTWAIVRGMLDMHRADGERALTASPAGD